MSESSSFRAFKTPWFGKAARKAAIRDAALLRAIREALKGQADDLGGGVLKKCLNDNLHRSIILARGGRNWVFVYLYAKQDRVNVDTDELAAFRKLARVYEGMAASEVALALSRGALLELKDDH